MEPFAVGEQLMPMAAVFPHTIGDMHCMAVITDGRASLRWRVFLADRDDYRLTESKKDM